MSNDFDPVAVFFRDHDGSSDGVAAVAGDLRQDLVILEQRHGDELAEQPPCWRSPCRSAEASAAAISADGRTPIINRARTSFSSS